MNRIIKAFGEVMMRLDVPEHRKLEQTRTLDISFSGTGVNILSALSKFGYNTSLLTTLPANGIGDAANSYIQSLGIGTNEVRRSGDHIGIYFYEHGYDVRPSVVTYTNREISSFCLATKADYDVKRLLSDTNMIHFCGIGLAISEQTRETVFSFAETAKKLGITVVFDCNFRPKLWGNSHEASSHYERMLALSDVCLMTEKDAMLLLGMETKQIETKNQIHDLIPKVAEQFGIHTIAGTIREYKDVNKHRIQGYLFQQGSFVFSKKYTFCILDRIGGGDGFTSGVMHGLLQGFSMSDTIEFAMASGVLAHTIRGDSPLCTEREVWAFVNNCDTDIER